MQFNALNFLIITLVTCPSTMYAFKINDLFYKTR